MLESFLLVLTLCGSLDGHTTCEKYVIDSRLSYTDCLESIATIHNNEKTSLYNVMGEVGEPWTMVDSQSLHCVKEDTE